METPITPSPDFSGDLKVPVTVTMGKMKATALS